MVGQGLKDSFMGWGGGCYLYHNWYDSLHPYVITDINQGTVTVLPI